MARRPSQAERIARALGGAEPAGAGWLAFCPCHNNTRTPALSLRDGDDGTLLVTCHGAQCDRVDILLELRRRGLFDDDRPAGPVRRSPSPAGNDNAGQARAIWAQCRPIIGSLGEVYLASRGLRLPPGCEDLRFHPACPRGRDRLPAMVALMRDVVSNAPTGVHRTYLRADGSGKADVEPAKMMLGKVGVLKASPDEDVTLGLGICEGIEDALAVLYRWAPVWSCLTAGGIAGFPVLAGIESLTIFADADAVGRRAAETCAARWVEAGREARIVLPDAKDFADMVSS